jgi:hypothetical protein
MKKSKLDIPHIKEQIVKGVASGANQTDLSRQIGFDQSTISKYVNREDIRELIEKEQAKLFEVVPDAVENVKSLVKGMKDLPANDSKGKELAYKASKDVLKIVGLMPSPTEGRAFQQFNIFNTGEQLRPSVLDMIGASSTTELPDDVVLEPDNEDADKE